jgi:hypothetical protein
MAKISSGILGGFSGKIKTIQGYRRNGKNIIQASPLKKNIPQNSTLLSNSNNLKLFWQLYQYHRYRFLQALHTAWPSTVFNPSTYLELGLNLTFTVSQRKSYPIIVKDGNSIMPTYTLTGTGSGTAAASMTITNLNAIRTKYGTLRARRISSNQRQGVTLNNNNTVAGNSITISTSPNNSPGNFAEHEMIQINSTNGLYKSHVMILFQKKNATP